MNKEYLEIKLKMGPIRDTVLHQVCLLLKNDLVDKPPELCVCPRAPGKLDASEFQLEPLQQLEVVPHSPHMVEHEHADQVQGGSPAGLVCLKLLVQGVPQHFLARCLNVLLKLRGLSLFWDLDFQVNRSLFWYEKWRNTLTTKQ